MSKRVQFWFEFASTYSYLSVMRLDEIAARRDVDVTWKPFLLGPIFKKNGWNTSPFGVYKAKGENMWRDMERRSAKYGLEFNVPDHGESGSFPRNSVNATRIAMLGLSEGWGKAFCRGVYVAEFVRGEDIGELGRLEAIAMTCGAPENIVERSRSDANKAALWARGEEAEALGLYGAPSFIVGDELFWGDDRLEDALEWASKTV